MEFRLRYYKSNKILGKLYRSIDEKKFFDQMKRDFEAKRPITATGSIVRQVENYIDRETKGFLWEHHRQFAEDTRQYFEDTMIDIMDTLRPHRGKPLTELEVVSGNILAKKERATNKYINEANQAVRDRFDWELGDILKSISKGGDEDDCREEKLPRAIACFKVALETAGWENQVYLKSWKYITASVCLEQLYCHRNGQLRTI